MAVFTGYTFASTVRRLRYAEGYDYDGAHYVDGDERRALPQSEPAAITRLNVHNASSSCAEISEQGLSTSDRR